MRVLSATADADADAVPGIVPIAPVPIADLSCNKTVCEGSDFQDGYPIVDELDVKTLPGGKSYRFWFRAGLTQAATRYGPGRSGGEFNVLCGPFCAMGLVWEGVKA